MSHTFRDVYLSTCKYYNFETIENLVTIWYSTNNLKFATFLKLIYGQKRLIDFASDSYYIDN